MKRVALIIDDNPDDRRVTARHLLKDRKLEYQIFEASTGPEGLELVEKVQPDLVILDNFLGDVRGTDLLVELRRRGHADVPVIVLTGSGEDDDASQDALELGATDYLNKDEATGPHIRRAAVNAVTKARIRALLAASERSLSEALAEVKQRMEFEARLIGVLGHDLRTPLGAVTAGVELLADEPGLSAAGQEIVERLARTSGHMAAIVRQVLDMTSVRRQGSFVVNRERCDVNELVGDRIAELRAAHAGRDIRYVAEGDCRGDFDPTALGQVVINLVNNAVSHGDAGSAVEVVVQGGDQVIQISVKNQGPPIPESLQATLFEPFTRDAATRVPGLGLGLYITKEIIQAHGAAIQVRSGADGTVFTVELPRTAP